MYAAFRSLSILANSENFSRFYIPGGEERLQITKASRRQLGLPLSSLSVCTRRAPEATFQVLSLSSLKSFCGGIPFTEDQLASLFSSMGTPSEVEVTLFTHRFSPYAQRVHVSLVEKGISFKPIFVDFSNKPKELIEANPIYQKVPTIIHNGNPLAESLVILEYLEDAWPETVALMPRDAFEKAKVRFWSDYIYKGFTNIIATISLKRGSPENQAGVEGILKFLKTLDDAMYGFSAKGPFFTGDKFEFLDVVLCPLTGLLPSMEKVIGFARPGLDEIPRFHKWSEATKAHPSVRSTIPSEEEILEYVTSMMKKRAEAAAKNDAPQ